MILKEMATYAHTHRHKVCMSITCWCWTSQHHHVTVMNKVSLVLHCQQACFQSPLFMFILNKNIILNVLIICNSYVRLTDDSIYLASISSSTGLSLRKFAFPCCSVALYNIYQQCGSVLGHTHPLMWGRQRTTDMTKKLENLSLIQNTPLHARCIKTFRVKVISVQRVGSGFVSQDCVVGHQEFLLLLHALYVLFVSQ